MEPVTTALRLLKRQAEIEHRQGQPGRLSILDERELFAIREHLKDFPAAVRAIAELTGARHKSTKSAWKTWNDGMRVARGRRQPRWIVIADPNGAGKRDICP